MEINVSKIKDSLTISYIEDQEIVSKRFKSEQLVHRFSEAETLLKTNNILIGFIVWYVNKDPSHLIDSLKANYQNYEIFPLEKNILYVSFSRKININLPPPAVENTHYRISLHGEEDSLQGSSELSVWVDETITEETVQSILEEDEDVHFVFGPKEPSIKHYINLSAVFATYEIERDPLEIEGTIKKLRRKVWKPLSKTIELLK